MPSFAGNTEPLLPADVWRRQTLKAVLRDGRHFESIDWVAFIATSLQKINVINVPRA